MKVIVPALVLLFFGPVLGIAVLFGIGGGAGASTAVASCPTSGPIRGLTLVQAGNARAIVAAAQQTTIAADLPAAAQKHAELIALMTAETESTLLNYSNPRVPGSAEVANDGPSPTGGDHDSVGLFQQRASWGPLAARMNPAAATKVFVARLLRVAAWQTIPAGVAAQAVQVSRYSDRYAQAEGAATGWLGQIETSPAAIRCGSDGLPASAVGNVPPGSIPRGYQIPAASTDAERRAVTFALAQLGKPYVFGAVGPDSYDCSGLTMAAWAAAGVELPHFTGAQYNMGTPVAARSLLSAGDLVFIPGSDGSLDPPVPRHVGLYIGNGYVIEAPQTGDVVKIIPVAHFTPIIGIRRVG